MFAYIARRLITAFFVVVGASFIVYMLMTWAGDPLEFLLNIQDPAERAFLYREIGTLHYDQAPLIAVPTQSPFIATRSNLQGVYFNPMYSDEFLWKDISKN